MADKPINHDEEVMKGFLNNLNQSQIDLLKKELDELEEVQADDEIEVGFSFLPLA